MKKLIVGLNDSDEAIDALRLGQALAAAGDAELHVAAVLPFDQWLVRDTEYDVARQKHFDEMFESADAHFDRLAGRADEVLNAYVPHRIDDISPAASLIDLANEIDADGIVVGSTELGPVERVAIGSVGEALAHGAPCAVFIAPRGFARGEQTNFEQIGVGYNGAPESETALAEAQSLAGDLNASLRLIGVVNRSDTPLRLGLGLDENGYYRYLREDMAKRLDRAADSVDAVRVETTLTEGKPAEELVRESAGMDLLVLGSRGYGPLRSVVLGAVSGKVMRSAECPVAIVPRASEKPREKANAQSDGVVGASA